MYNLVPADSEAHKHPPKKPFNVPDGIMPDQMVNQPRSKTSLFQSFNVAEKNRGCDICGKTYKNKKSLADHKRRYHSKLPLRLFSNRKEEKFTSDRENGSDSDQSGDSMKYGDDISRKRNISPDTNASRKKHIVSELKTVILMTINRLNIQKVRNQYMGLELLSVIHLEKEV